MRELHTLKGNACKGWKEKEKKEEEEAYHARALRSLSLYTQIDIIYIHTTHTLTQPPYAELTEAVSACACASLFYTPLVMSLMYSRSIFCFFFLFLFCIFFFLFQKPRYTLCVS